MGLPAHTHERNQAMREIKDFTASKVISGYNVIDDLKQFGIEYLTSESCGYSMRGLYDVDSRGQALLSAFFGGIEFTARGWNASDKKSIMLSRYVLIDLLIFCHLESGFEVAIYANPDDSKAIGLQPMIRFYDNFEDYKIERERLESWGLNYRLYTGKNRNRHAFSGRIE